MSNVGSPPRHYCDHVDCGKSFRRAEHLNRHRLNHTNSTIPCPQCGRLFYRKDLLQRHLTLKHGKTARANRNAETSLQGETAVSPVTYERTSHNAASSSPSIQGIDAPVQFPATSFGTNGLETGAASLGDVLPISDETFPFPSPSLNLPQDWGWLQQYPLPVLPVAFAHGAHASNNDYHGFQGLVNEWIDTSSSQDLYISQDIYDFLLTLTSNIEAGLSLTTQDVSLSMNTGFQFIAESLPIFHRPSFSLDLIERQLCASIFCIGQLISPEPAIYQSGTNLLRQIRFELLKYVDENAIQIAKLGILQAMLLVEFSGMYLADRAAMELSDILHGTLVTLSRRLGLFDMTYETTRATSAAGDGNEWRSPVERESVKRLAYFVFTLDIEHALLFGHERSILSVYSMKLELPSEEGGWQISGHGAHEATHHTKFSLLCGHLLSSAQGHMSMAPITNQLSNFILMLGLSSIVLDLLRRQQDPFFDTKQALSRLGSVLPAVHGRLLGGPDGMMKLHGRAVYHITAIALCTPLEDLERAANDGFSRTGRTPKQHTRAAIIRLLTKHKVGAEPARHAVHLLKLFSSPLSNPHTLIGQVDGSYTASSNLPGYSHYEPSALYFGVLTLWAYVIGRVGDDEEEIVQRSEHDHLPDGSLQSPQGSNASSSIASIAALLQDMEIAINRNDGLACRTTWRAIVQHVTGMLAPRQNCNAQEYCQVLGSLSDSLSI